jgi:hypothetical protein
MAFLDYALDPIGQPGRDAQQSAIDRQVATAQDINKNWMNQYTDLFNQGTEAYNKSKVAINDMYGEAQKGLQGVFATRDVALNDLLSGIRTTGRNQAAQSGLIGGGQEAASVDPALQSATTQEGNAQTSMQSDLLTNYNNALSSLDQTNLARIGNLSSGALGQLSSSNSALIASLANYANPAGAAAGGALSGLSTGMNIMQYFGSK